MSIPLKYRKLTKEAVAGLEEKLKTASDLVGVPLTFVDTTAEIYAATAAISETEPEKIKDLADYGTYLIEALKPLVATEIGKEAVANMFKKSDGKVRFIVKGKEVSLEDYWIFDDQGLGIEIREDAIGAWSGYYSVEALEKTIDAPLDGAAISLKQRLSLVNVQPEIDAALKSASAAYGKDLIWDPDYANLWKWLVDNGDQYANKSSNLGNVIRDYVVFFTDIFKEFIANPDNKEAMQDKLTTNKLGFSLQHKDAPGYVQWSWEDGKLTMDTKGGYFGCWLTTSYYSLELLEATF